MNTFQIKDVMRHLFKHRPSVQYDCVPCDYLVNVRIRSYPFAFCVNDETSDKPGNHWVGVYIDNPKAPMEFFCSFGRAMSTYLFYFNTFAVNNRLYVNQTNLDLQSIDSTLCGNHVLHFLYSRVKHISFSLFYFKHKGKSTRDNDAYVDEFVRRILERCNK